MKAFVAFLTLAVFTGTGCGSAGRADEAAAPGRQTRTLPDPAPPPGIETSATCRRVGLPGYRACTGTTMRQCTRKHWKASRCEVGAWRTIRSHTTIQRRSEGGWRVVATQPPSAVVHDLAAGFWRDAWLSPDGRTLLLQWAGECESPRAFFTRTRGGGRLRPVTGERDWRKSPESVALGWAADGRARVLLLQGYCGPAHREPGEYLVDPASGSFERVGPLPDPYAG